MIWASPFSLCTGRGGRRWRPSPPETSYETCLCCEFTQILCQYGCQQIYMLINLLKYNFINTNHILQVYLSKNNKFYGNKDFCYMFIYLKPDSGNVTDGVTLTTETRNQHFVVLFNVVEATVPRYECSHLLAVLDQLHPDTLPDGRVRLLGLYSTGHRKQFINILVHNIHLCNKIVHLKLQI